MKNTFDMARARRELRAAITAPRRHESASLSAGKNATVTRRTAVASGIEFGLEEASEAGWVERTGCQQPFFVEVDRMLEGRGWG